MNSRLIPPVRRPSSAFTVVELMVAVSVLTLIVVVLYNMFDNTQRAMRGNAAQVDVMEGGRAAVELMARDLEQMTDLGFVDAINFYVASWSRPTVQSMPGPTNALNTRMNSQQELFFTSRFNKEASGVGYRVVPDIGVGSLYRFVTNVPLTSLPTNYPSRDYFLLANTNNPQLFQRVTDGVVHFRVTAFDSQGRAIEPYAPRVNPYWTNVYANLWVTNEQHPTLPRYRFTNTAVPAAVEVELGILEPYVFERYRAMTNNRSAASNYLARQATRMHLFQQRVTVRSATPLLPLP